MPHTNYVTLECDGKQVTAPFPVLAAATEMYALLKELEYAGHDGVGDDMRVGVCPECTMSKNWEHRDDCRLAAVLKAVEGE